LKRVEELNENNNVFNTTFSVTEPITDELPDLIIESISLDPATPRAGDAVSVAVTVRNQGGADFPAIDNAVEISVSSIAGGYTGAFNLTDALAAGNSVQLTSIVNQRGGGDNPFSVAGDVDVTTVADPSNVIEEENESNNSFATTFNVLPSLNTDLTGPGEQPDGEVNVTDLAFMLSRWERSDADALRADVNLDNSVNIIDLSILLADWGR
jgi:subtilase family serine protease